MRPKPEWMFVMLAVAGCGSSRAQCFSTAAAAASQSGVEARDGFRLTGTLRDPLRGGVWARVKRCGHPEWPGLVVAMPVGEAGTVGVARKERSELGLKQAGAGSQALVQVRDRHPEVTAGGTVVVMEQSEMVQLQVAGVALGNAGVGERVKVRIGSQEFLTGIVRAAGVVEIR